MAEPERQGDYAEFVASLPPDAEFMDFDLPEIEAAHHLDTLARVLADRVVGHLDANPAGDKPLWFTVKETAAEYRVSERLVRDLLARGDLVGAAVRLGGIWRINRHRLERVLGLEDADGVAGTEETGEPRDGQDGDVLGGVVEGSGANHHPGHRLLARIRGQAGSQDPRGQTRRRRRGSAAEFRALLLGDEEDQPEAG